MSQPYVSALWAQHIETRKRPMYIIAWAMRHIIDIRSLKCEPILPKREPWAQSVRCEPKAWAVSHNRKPLSESLCSNTLFGRDLCAYLRVMLCNDSQWGKWQCCLEECGNSFWMRFLCLSPSTTMHWLVMGKKVMLSSSLREQELLLLNKSYVSISECELTCNKRSGNVIFGTSGAKAYRGARACGGARARVRYEILICICGSPYIHKAGP